jgi:hypothetical protein
MSLIFATQLTAVATVVLAAFAIVTAWYARRAFLKQSQEVRAIEQQVKDQQELTRQQADLLNVQSGQLELQRQQFAQEQADRRRAQASRVFITISRDPSQGASDPGTVTVRVTNTSQQPVYDLTIGWRKGTAPWDGPDSEEVLMPEASAVRIRSLPDGLPANADRSLYCGE